MNHVKLEQHPLPYGMEEELKTLRTNLRFLGSEKRVILVTSCASGDGKSLITLETARCLTGLGLKVLMLDADLRRSQLKNRITEGLSDGGLTHYLTEQLTFEEILCETDTKGLFLIPAGHVPPNPAELLAGERFATLIRQVRRRFDYVLVDCPPLGAVADALVISPHCDGSLMVISVGRVRRREAQEVMTQLRRAQCPVLGAVLNRVSTSQNGYYRRYYKKYTEYK